MRDVSFSRDAGWIADCLKPPPRNLRTAEWAERYRKVFLTSSPGEWKNSTNPMLVPIMELLDDPTIREVALKKAVQTGGSETARNWIARLAHTAGRCPAMLILPDAKSGRKLIKKYWRPVLSGKEVASLREHRSPRKSDNTLENIALLTGFDLQLGYSGSAQSLASEPRKIAVLDETDKFKDWDAREAEPVDLVRRRLTTFDETSKLYALSTPTTPEGQINQLFEASDFKMFPFVACPKCSRPVQLVFTNLNYELPDKKTLPDNKDRAKLLRLEPDRVYLKCPACDHKIHERERKHLLHTGFFATTDQQFRICVDGRRFGTKPPGSKVGVHLPALASAVGDGMVAIAARWVEAQGIPHKIQDCKNNDQGEPFQWDLIKPNAGDLHKKCRPDPETGWKPPKARLIPGWATRLIMTVDTQKDHFYYVIRAWGAHMRSRLILHGKAFSFDELNTLIYSTAFQNEDPRLPSRRVWTCGIDTGGGVELEGSDINRTEQVYQWCSVDPRRRIALKGSNRPLESMTRRVAKEYASPSGSAVALHMFRIDSLLTGDQLAQFITERVELMNPDGELISVDRWELNEEVDNEYLRHITVMQVKTRKKGNKNIRFWAPEFEGARHDWHDCERYNIALAHTVGVGCIGLPDMDAILAEASANSMKATVAKGQHGVRTPDGRQYFVNRRNV